MISLEQRAATSGRLVVDDATILARSPPQRKRLVTAMTEIDQVSAFCSRISSMRVTHATNATTLAWFQDRAGANLVEFEHGGDPWGRPVPAGALGAV
jgi:hypothetical protein